MVTLIILRGVPGSGKSTVADVLGARIEADDFFHGPDGYVYDRARIGEAHADCQKRCWAALLDAQQCGAGTVVVSNTNTMPEHFEPYIQMAKDLGIQYFVLTVENWHGGSSVHAVPSETVRKMANNIRRTMRLLPQDSMLEAMPA